MTSTYVMYVGKKLTGTIFFSVNPYKGKIDDQTVKDLYIYINEVDSEYTRMGMANRFEGDCVRRYVRDVKNCYLMPVGISIVSNRS